MPLVRSGFVTSHSSLEVRILFPARRSWPWTALYCGLLEALTTACPRSRLSLVSDLFKSAKKKVIFFCAVVTGESGDVTGVGWAAIRIVSGLRGDPLRRSWGRTRHESCGRFQTPASVESPWGPPGASAFLSISCRSLNVDCPNGCRLPGLQSPASIDIELPVSTVALFPSLPLVQT